MNTLTQNNFKATPRPIQFNIHAWDTLKKYATRIWSSYSAGVEWKEEISITCKEFFEMLKDEHGNLIVDSKLLNWVPNHRINTWYRDLKSKANLNYKLGDYRAASALFEQMLLIKSSDYFALCMAASCAVKLREYQRAFQLLNSAILKFPLFDRAFLIRAELFSLRDEDECALKDLNRSLNLRPSNTEARLKRAMIFKSLGSLNLAIRDLDQLIEQESEAIAPLFEKAIIMEDLDDLASAYSLYKRALTIDPFQKEVLFRKAQICVKLKQNMKKAKEDLLLARDLGHAKAEELFLNQFVNIEKLGLAMK